MKDSHYRISLDIHSTQSQVSLPVKQGDTSRKVFISLCEGGKPYHIEDDCFAVFCARKPDGEEIDNNCIIADNVIEYTFTDQTTAASGIVNSEIRLYGVDSGLITSPRFTVIVDSRVVSDANIESSSEYTALDTLVSEAVNTIAVANDKAGYAQTQGDHALEKGNYANEMAELAKSKAADALTAKYAADAAATRANTAEGEASKAATAATTAATSAATATDNANMAATRANTAATNANSVADGISSSVSNALKGTASGNPLRIDDVSPLEHEMNVKVHGKNLFDGVIENAVRTYADGKYYANQVYVANANMIPIVGGEQYTFQFVSDVGKIHGVLFYKSDGAFLSTIGLSTNVANSFTFRAPDEAKYFCFNIYNGDGITTSDVHSVQLELGETATAYEPWLDPTTATLTRYGASETDNPQTYTPNADGTVEVTSLYPTTTLICDTAGVTIEAEYNKDLNKVIADLIDRIGSGGSGASAFITDITILASKWVGTSSPYSQVVTVEGATKRSQVDLTPSVEQLATFRSKDLTFVTENIDGVITVYAIGQKPTNDYTIQATVTEVNV